MKARIEWIRRHARRLREIAELEPSSPISPELLDMAAELEQEAEMLERAACGLAPEE